MLTALFVMWIPMCMQDPEGYRRQCDAIDEPVLIRRLLKQYYERRDMGYSERLNYEIIPLLHEYLHDVKYPPKVSLKSVVRVIGNTITERVSGIGGLDEFERKATLGDAISAALFGFGYVRTGKNGLYIRSR